MPRLFRYQELSFDMHQVLSTQSFPGNQTSLYSLSFAIDYLDAISVVILIQSPRPLSQSMTSLLVFDRFVHTHVVVICFASDMHPSLYVSRLARMLLYMFRVWHALFFMFRVWHAFFFICSASGTRSSLYVSHASCIIINMATPSGFTPYFVRCVSG